MKKTIFHIILLTLIGCQNSNKVVTKSDNFTNFKIVQFSYIKELQFSTPINSITIIGNDSIEIEHYCYSFKENKYKVFPSYYIGKINNEQFLKLNELIENTDFEKKSDTILKYPRFDSYNIYIKLKDKNIRAESLDLRLIDHNTKIIIDYINVIADTLKLKKVDYFKQYQTRGWEIPPLPFDNFIEISNL
jgi:hypothetical protein